MPKRDLDDDIKQQALWIVRGYKASLRRYMAARQDVILATPCSFGEYVSEGETRRQYFPHSSEVGRPVENMQQALERLEQCPDARRVAAVDKAKLLIGEDLQDEELRRKLTNAILLNCESGRNYPFEILGVDGLSRMDFYRRRNRFLQTVAENFGLI